MSLFDYLNNDSSSTSSLSSQMQLLVQQAAAKVSATTTSTTETPASTPTSTSSVYITLGAMRANAEAGDAKKDAAALAKELRATLDKGGKGAAMGGLSGRALSIMALDDSGTFSPTEAAAAKAELRERDRAAALAFLNSGELTASSLKTYGQNLLAARQSMSAEEQALRSSDPNLR